MKKKLILGLVFIGAMTLFAAGTTTAEAAGNQPAAMSLSAEERAALQNSLALLTQTLQMLQASISKTGNLPPNIDEIAATLGQINQSLAQISATISQRTLAAQPTAASKEGMALKAEPQPAQAKTSKETASTIKEELKDVVLREADKESEDLTAKETAQPAATSFIIGRRGWFIVAVLAIIAGFIYWVMRSKKQPQDSTTSQNQPVKI